MQEPSRQKAIESLKINIRATSLLCYFADFQHAYAGWKDMEQKRVKRKQAWRKVTI